MSADYDRLFQPIDGVEVDQVPDDATARVDYGVSQELPNPPMPVVLPRPNGLPKPPIPVDPPRPNGQPKPPMPIGESRRVPPASPEPAAVPSESWTPAIDQHARHAHRRRRNHDNNGNGGWKAAPGKTVPLLPRADPSGPAPAQTHHRATSKRVHNDGRRVGRPAVQSNSASAVASEDRSTSRARSADVTPAPNKRAAKPVPRRGWRRWLYRLTRINPGLSRDEKYELDLRTRIRRSPRGPYLIGVLGLKGGAGKTALTVALGSVIAAVRGDRILVIDADPGSGNLADRVGRQSKASIANLLANNRMAHYNDIRAHTSVNAVNLEVLSSVAYGSSQRALSEQEWSVAVDAASRFYNLVLADCGGGLSGPATRGLLPTVSAVVIVASASVDGVRQAAIATQWLQHNGYDDLLKRAAMVITQAVPGLSNKEVRDLVGRFERQIQPDRIVVLPWDKHIASGTEVQLDQLGDTYKRRILELAAALSDDFDRAVIR